MAAGQISTAGPELFSTTMRIKRIRQHCCPVLKLCIRDRKYDEETTENADFGSYEVQGNKVEFEVFNPDDRAYDKVTVTGGADGNATGASVEFIGK